MIYSVNAYAYAKKVGDGWNCNIVSYDKANQLLKDGKDNGLNLRLEDDKDCLVFGDIDHCPDEDTANNIFQMICEDFIVNDTQISKSFSYKEDVKEFSYHWTIPSLKSNFKTLKHIFNQEKYKEFKNMVDTSPYKNGWFRLPYQTTKEKKLTHKIIQGNPTDFFVQNIPDDTQLFHYEIIEIKKETKQKENKQVNKVMKNEDYEENDMKIKKILEFHLLDKKANGSWDDWAEVGMAMKQSNPDGLDNFSTFSKINKEKYNSDETITFWNGVKVKNDNEDKLTIGSLMMWAKECNKDTYCINFNPFLSITDIEKGALSIANKISYDLRKHLKYSNDDFYCYDKQTCLWFKTKQPCKIVIETLHTYLDHSLKYYTDLLCEEKEETKRKELQDNIKFYSKSYGKTDNKGFYGMIIMHLQCILKDNHFIHKLDNKKYYLAFKNGLYNLKTNDFEEGLKETDYLTETIPHDYTPSNDDDRQKVIDILYKICNHNKEHLEYYLSILGYTMIGDPEKEKSMYFLIGTKGNNGKTLIMNTLADIMPNYCKKIDRQTFEEDYKKSHKNLIGTKGKRLVHLEEFSEKKLNIEMLKEYADGKTIEVEIMYGTTEKVNISSKLFFCSNPTPNFKTEGGIENRYKQLSFNSHFHTDYIEDNFDTLQFKLDNTLQDKLKHNLNHALISLLIEYGHKYTKTNEIDIPKDFLENQKDTLESNDEV